MNFANFRHHLHSIAELSGKEENSANFIYKFLKSLAPDHLYKNVGGHGVIAVFEASRKGPVIAFRSELDALPVAEENNLFYASVNNGVSHKCGHDGHSTILAAFGEYVANSRPLIGKAILLFQPAEETGEGAIAILNDTIYSSLNPDYIFALHNLPGFPKNSIITRSGYFACASHGIIINLQGVESHASEPEKGESPAEMMAELISELPILANPDPLANDYSLCTVTHANLGSYSFGISPGKAQVLITLRAYTNQNLDELSNRVISLIDKKCNGKNIRVTTEIVEQFPATINDKEAVRIIEKAAGITGRELIEVTEPFKWSEDFGHYSKDFTYDESEGLNESGGVKSALFGLGSGIDTPNLHNPHYDFPNDIIETGVEIYKSIYNSLLNH